MGRPLRLYDDPETVHFVTNRCLQERYLLKPTEAVNRIILSCFARSLARHPVKAMGFGFLSNHSHLLLKPTSLHVCSFTQYFQSILAV